MMYHKRLNLLTVLVFVAIVTITITLTIPFLSLTKTQSLFLTHQQRLRQLALAINTYVTNISPGQLPPSLDELVRYGLCNPADTYVPLPNEKDSVRILYFPDIRYSLIGGQEILLASPYPLFYRHQSIRTVVYPDLHVHQITEEKFQDFLKLYQQKRKID